MNGSKGFMITNNAANHSAEDWAVATADHLVHSTQDHKLAALKLELAVVEILTRHHQELQDAEKKALQESGVTHTKTHIDPRQEAEQATQEILEAAKGTPFENLWSREEVQNQIFDTIYNHFGTSVHNERCAHTA